MKENHVLQSADFTKTIFLGDADIADTVFRKRADFEKC